MLNSPFKTRELQWFINVQYIHYALVWGICKMVSAVMYGPCINCHDREKMVKLEKSNEILEKRLKQMGDETNTDGKVNKLHSSHQSFPEKY